MPLQLTGSLLDSDTVRWRVSVDTNGASDKTLVLSVSPALLSALPGLRSSREGWTLDISKLPLMREALGGADWIPRKGTFVASVKPGLGSNYDITLKF